MLSTHALQHGLRARTCTYNIIVLLKAYVRQVLQLLTGTPHADEAPEKLSLSEADNPSVIATTLLTGAGRPGK